MKSKIQKTREIVWSSGRAEAMVGNDDGTVTVWSAKKGASICKLQSVTIF
jgi:WD40 repeat protein